MVWHGNTSQQEALTFSKYSRYPHYEKETNYSILLFYSNLFYSYSHSYSYSYSIPIPIPIRIPIPSATPAPTPIPILF